MQHYPNPTDPGKGVEDDDDRKSGEGDERRDPETGQPRRDKDEPRDLSRP